MRTVRFLILGLFFLPALTLFIGCGGGEVDTAAEDAAMEENDPAMDESMVETNEGGDRP